MLTWINAGCDVGLGLPKCQAMHPTSVWVNDGPWGVQRRLPLLRCERTFVRQSDHFRKVPRGDSCTAANGSDHLVASCWRCNGTSRSKAFAAFILRGLRLRAAPA